MSPRQEKPPEWIRSALLANIPLVPAQREWIRQPVVTNPDDRDVVAVNDSNPVLRPNRNADASLRAGVDLEKPQSLMANGRVERVYGEMILLGEYE